MKSADLRSRYLIGVVALVYYISMFFTIGLGHELWGDEGHFYETIQLFYEKIDIHNLKTYNELSTPLPFLFQAIWARITSIQLPYLRCFDMLISILFFLFVWFGLLKTENTFFQWMAVVLICSNPYFYGVSFFVYTDIWCILFLSVALYFDKRGALVYCNVFLALTILCRQYAVFVLPFLTIRHLNLKSLKIFDLFRYAPSLIPYLFLILFWGGMSPDNELRGIYLVESNYIRWGTIWIYPVFAGLYFLILTVVGVFHDKKLNYKLLFFGVALGVLVCLLPFEVSEASHKAGFDHLGFIHKYSFHFVGELGFRFLVILGVVSCSYLCVRFKDFVWLLLCFSLTMVLGSIVWEKYILLLMPVMLFHFDLNKLKTSTDTKD